MKYTNLTPDDVFQVVNIFTTDKKFKETIKGYNLSLKELCKVVEDLFYEINDERGYSFKGMKTEDITMFKQFLKFAIKTNVNLVMSK